VDDTASVEEVSEEAPGNGGTKAPVADPAPVANGGRASAKTSANGGSASAKAYMSPKPYEPAGFLNGFDILEEVVPASPLSCSVLQLFEKCVSDESDMEQQYHEQRNDSEIVIGKWTDDAQFGKVRSNSYVVKLSDPIGPKSSRSEEKQRYNLQEDKLVLETYSSMLDAPFGDRFRVESIIEATATGPTSCNVTIRCKPVFSAKSMLEGTITKKTMSGMRESMQQWCDMAKERVGGGGGAPATAVEAPAPKEPPAREEGRLVVELDLSIVAELLGEVIKYRVVLVPLLFNIFLTLWLLVRR